MTKTLFKSRYNPKYKIKSQTQIIKDVTSSNLPSNLQNFKQKLLSGNCFMKYQVVLYLIHKCWRLSIDRWFKNQKMMIQ